VLEPILKSDKCDAVAGGSVGVERIAINFANPDSALGDKRSEPDQPHPFLTDLRVRQAINKAIDRKAIATQLYGASGSPTCNIVVVPADLNSPNTKCDRDVEGAKKLLADAGFTPGSDGILQKDGKPLKLLYQTTVNQVRQGAQAIVKANLAEVGIMVELKSIDAGVFFGGDPGNPDTLNKMYADLQMYTNGPDGPDPTGYLGGWTCAKVNSAKNQWQGGNDGRYCNKDYDALYEQYSKEMDPTKHKAMAIQLNDMLVNDVVIIPLVNRVTPNGKAKNLEGPTYNTFDSNWWNINTWKRK
jgi:peptide/nickel transport system substrate-binding protein